MKMIKNRVNDNEVQIRSWNISFQYGILSAPRDRELLLEPRLSKLLYLLSCHENSVVSREYLIKKIWPDTVVNEESLTRAVADLRKKIASNFSEELEITTVPKRGYKLTLCSKDQSALASNKVRRRQFAVYGTAALLLGILWLAGILKVVVIS